MMLSVTIIQLMMQIQPVLELSQVGTRCSSIYDNSAQDCQMEKTYIGSQSSLFG